MGRYEKINIVKETRGYKMYLTKEDVAKKFQVSTKTITTWMKEKNLPYSKLGSRVRFSEQEVDEWFKSRR